MSGVEIDYGGEGRCDAEAAARMIVAMGARPGRNFTQRPQARGKEALDKALAGYNAGARFTPNLVLRDLDRGGCAGGLVTALLPNRSAGCLLRIAVRSLDAWLMADGDAIARFAGVRRGVVPERPEELLHPKISLVAMLRHTKQRTLRADLDLDGDGPTWQMLGGWTADFIRSDWDPVRAASTGCAPSLERALARLGDLVRRTA